MVVILRCWKTEQGLQQHVQVRCSLEVRPAHDMRDTLKSVVHHDGEMITRGRILAHEDDIAPEARCAGRALLTETGVETAVPEIPRGNIERPVHREAPDVRLTRRDAARSLVQRDGSTGTGIEGRSVGIRHRPFFCCSTLGDIPSGAETWIKEVALSQPRRRVTVILEMIRLPPDRLLPGETEPGEVFDDTRDKGGTAALEIDVLDPQQEASTSTPGEFLVQESGPGMAEMEPPIGARREPEDGRIMRYHSCDGFRDIAGLSGRRGMVGDPGIEEPRPWPADLSLPRPDYTAEPQLVTSPRNT